MNLIDEQNRLKLLQNKEKEIKESTNGLKNYIDSNIYYNKVGNLINSDNRKIVFDKLIKSSSGQTTITDLLTKKDTTNFGNSILDFSKPSKAINDKEQISSKITDPMLLSRMHNDTSGQIVRFFNPVKVFNSRAGRYQATFSLNLTRFGHPTCTNNLTIDLVTTSGRHIRNFINRTSSLDFNDDFLIEIYLERGEDIDHFVINKHNINCNDSSFNIYSASLKLKFIGASEQKDTLFIKRMKKETTSP